MTAGKASLVAIDGVNDTAVRAAARGVVQATDRRLQAGVSGWDASGVFEDLAVAGEEAGTPSPRTLLLLYAADLAFRLRWEIRPALEEGRVVVAAPYVDTAVAFGRTAGLKGDWLTELFGFAPRPDETRYVDAAPPRSAAKREGFIHFGCERMAARHNGLTLRQLIDRTRAHLQAAARRQSRRHKS